MKTTTYRIDRNWGTDDSPEWEETDWRGNAPISDEEAIRKIDGLPNQYRITRIVTITIETQIFPEGK